LNLIKAENIQLIIIRRGTGKRKEFPNYKKIERCKTVLGIVHSENIKLQICKDGQKVGF
jgi:hypothetical protein